MYVHVLHAEAAAAKLIFLLFLKTEQILEMLGN